MQALAPLALHRSPTMTAQAGPCAKTLASKHGLRLGQLCRTDADTRVHVMARPLVTRSWPGQAPGHACGYPRVW